MAELTRGTIFDRPWGRTLAALGLRGLTGQLTLGVDGKHYEIAFSNGAVVGAASPLASDAAVRVALTGGLVSTTQVADLARKQAAAPGRDEVELISEHLKLGFDQSMRLRRRTIAQRAARSFSIEKGDFVVTDEITLPVVTGSELDIRAIIYLGAKQNLSEARLASELGLFGTWFRLKPEAFEDLPQFGFSEAERPIIDGLLNGASLGELEGIVGIDPRDVRATLYALCCANACNVEQTRGQGPTKPPPLRSSGSDPGVPRRAHTESGVPRRAQTEPGSRRTGTTDPDIARTTDSGIRRTGSSQPPATQPTAAAPTRSKVPTQQPLVAYHPGIRQRGKSAPPPNTTQTPVSAATSAPPPNTTQTPVAATSPGTLPPRTYPALDSDRQPDPGFVRTGSGSNPGVPRSRTPTGAPPSRGTPTAAPPNTPAAPRTAPPAAAPHSAGTAAPANRPLTSATEVQQLIATRAKLLEQGADHYALIGIGPKASADDVRKTYFNLARNLHPDRLTALGIADDAHVAHRVFSQLNTAFSILSDTKRRADYDELLGRGGEGALREEQSRAEDMAMRIIAAEEAYKRGEMALKRDDFTNAISELERAVELHPDEPDFYAMHAWAMFCATPDKASIAKQTRATLERAIQKSPKAITPRFILGRVERILGRDKEALDLFRDVLLDKPQHFEAQSEIRAIETRLQSNSPKGRKR